MNSREKGCRGEREFASLMREYGFTDAQRGQQYNGKGNADVVQCLPGVHPEVKRRENISLEDALGQAINDAKGGALPIVFHRKNRGKWRATMPLDVFMEIYREWYSGKVMKDELA